MDDSDPSRSLSTLKFRLSQSLKFFKMRFRQMEERQETESEMLSFVSGLGMVALKDFGDPDFEMNFRLEAILIETLTEAYQQ